MEFLGVSIRCPGDSVVVDISSERRKKLLHIIHNALEKGVLENDHAYSLAGKLNFAQSRVFSKVGRAFFSSIYAHEKARTGKLSISLRGDSEWWSCFLSIARPKLIRACRGGLDYVLYTDAAVQNETG